MCGATRSCFLLPYDISYVYTCIHTRRILSCFGLRYITYSVQVRYVIYSYLLYTSSRVYVWCGSLALCVSGSVGTMRLLVFFFSLVYETGQQHRILDLSSFSFAVGECIVYASGMDLWLGS